MRRLCVIVACVLALAVLLSVSAYADTRLITSVTSTTIANPIDRSPNGGTQYGWLQVRLRSQSGVATPNGSASSYVQPGKGSPGPTPPGHYFFTAGENSDGNENPQAWLATDYYSGMIEEEVGGNLVIRGPKLDNISKLSYFAILEKRGQYSRKLLSNSYDDSNFHIKYGDDIYVIGYNADTKTFERLAESSTEPGATLIDNPYFDSAFRAKYDYEYQYSQFAAQPPAMVLYITLADGINKRVLIYRPWSTTANKGMGPYDGSLSDRWKKYNCLIDGYWWDPYGAVNPADGTYFWTWSEILTKYPGAYIATPSLPTLGVVYNADSQPGTAPTGCAINFVLGSLNNAWWPESYAAQGAISKFQIAFADSGVTVDDEYNWARAGYGTTGEKTAMLNNKAMFENIYMPVPRVPSARTSATWGTWGGGAVAAANMNAVQRAGNYNYYSASTGSYANTFVIYGKVLADPAPTGDTLYLDDGSGKNVLVYSGDGFTDAYIGGEYIRAKGNCWVPNPYDWVYNNFHIIGLTGSSWRDPNGTWTDIVTRGHDSEFHTYSWNVQTLHNAF